MLQLLLRLRQPLGESALQWHPGVVLLLVLRLFGHGYFLRLLALFLALLLFLLLLQRQHELLDLFGVGGRPENLHRIFFEGCDPRLHVRRVLTRIVTDANFVAENHAGDFGTQLLLGITLGAKGMGQVTAKT